MGNAVKLGDSDTGHGNHLPTPVAAGHQRLRLMVCRWPDKAIRWLLTAMTGALAAVHPAYSLTVNPRRERGMV